MNAAERTAQLRSLFYEEPDPDVWDQILGLFEDWDYKDDLQVGIDYADAMLKHWPDNLRIARPAWSRVLLGEPKYLIQRAWERGKRAHPAMQLVRHLDLSTQTIPRFKGAKLKNLVKTKALQQLASLSLDHQDIGDDGTYELSENKHLRSLKHLSLQSCDLGPQGIWDLLEGEIIQGLESLNLRYNPIGDEGVRGIEQDPGVSTLRSLNLSYCRLSNQGWETLAACPHLQELEALYMGGNYYSDTSALRALKQATFAPNLKTLHLESYRLGGTLISLLVEGCFPSIKRIFVDGAECEPRKAEVFAIWAESQELEEISANYASPHLQKEIRALQQKNGALKVSLKTSAP